MESLIIILLAFFALFSLVLLRLPAAFAMMLVGGFGVIYLFGLESFLNQIKHLPLGYFSTYELAVIPIFLLMGSLMGRSGISGDLFLSACVALRRVKGGGLMASLVACSGFSMICGSSVATASVMGSTAYSQLKRAGYSASLIVATLAVGGTLGILIPPSIVLVIYAVLTEANVLNLFLAALLPAVLAVIFFMFVIFWQTRNREAVIQSLVFQETSATFIKTFFGIVLIFGCLLGGMIVGWFSPTSAAAFAVLLILGVLLYRGRLSFFLLKEALLETAGSSAMIFLLLLGAEILKIFFARANLPQWLAYQVSLSSLDPFLVIFLLLLVLVIMGMIMDSLSTILLTIPFLWPALVVLNGGDAVSAEMAYFKMDNEDLKIWFGILALVVVELGLITPPVGLNVFVLLERVEGVLSIDVFKALIPFVGIELLRVAMMVLAPVIILGLPRFVNAGLF